MKMTCHYCRNELTRKQALTDTINNSPRSRKGHSCSSSGTSLAVCLRVNMRNQTGHFPSPWRCRPLVSISGLFMVPGACWVAMPMKCQKMPCLSFASDAPLLLCFVNGLQLSFPDGLCHYAVSWHPTFSLLVWGCIWTKIGADACRHSLCRLR